MEEIIFPNQIRMIRRTRGKTMKDIASILDISLSAVSKIEKGYRRIDAEQLDKICHFLHCPRESIFVFEKTSQPEVVDAWQHEKERRQKINENSGMKTLGAGFRYLRGEKRLTLLDVARGSGMTIAVYHRIEMGQREVSEEQFSAIAHALGYSAESLQLKIYELDRSGVLQNFKKAKLSGIFHPKGGYNDLPVKNISLIPHLPCYEENAPEAQPDEQELVYPEIKGCFAVRMNNFQLGGKIKVLVNTECPVNDGLAIYQNEGRFILVSCQRRGETYFIREIGSNQEHQCLFQLKKVVAILPE